MGVRRNGVRAAGPAGTPRDRGDPGKSGAAGDSADAGDNRRDISLASAASLLRLVTRSTPLPDPGALTICTFPAFPDGLPPTPADERITANTKKAKANVTLKSK